MPTFDIPRWQIALDANRDVFSGLVAGARIGLLEEVGMRAPPCPMLVWERAANPHGMIARSGRFEGFSEAAVDLLLVARNGALEDLETNPGEDAIERLGAMVGEGAFVFFVFRTRDELEERGLEELIEVLGLAFIGACR